MPDSGRLRIDWKRLDLGDVITIYIMLIGLGAGYTDIKRDIRENAEKAQMKFETYDKQFEAQKATDREQNARNVQAYQELQTALKELKNDLRSDLKDIKTDMAVRAAGNNGRTVR